ncbi:hypothetical protein DENIS_2628 [Desulfonema ishimotonii]|uniref:Uncharacterized protein n=1 Tax=Desulfonema ishimotonii TaxID=45657 RepID=A0A401FXJ1_9BACT|nr:hypothetical protein DENIS_2628 [Desulfonema ishimotonii]
MPETAPPAAQTEWNTRQETLIRIVKQHQQGNARQGLKDLEKVTGKIFRFRQPAPDGGTGRFQGRQPA